MYYCTYLNIVLFSSWFLQSINQKLTIHNSRVRITRMYRTKVAQLLHPQLPPLLPNVHSGLSKVFKIIEILNTKWFKSFFVIVSISMFFFFFAQNWRQQDSGNRNSSSHGKSWAYEADAKLTIEIWCSVFGF